MKKKSKEKGIRLVLFLFSLFILVFGVYLYPKEGNYGQLKKSVKQLERDLNYKKIETTSLLEEIHQGQEAIDQLVHLENTWQKIKLPNFSSSQLNSYLFDTSLAHYPVLASRQIKADKDSPFYSLGEMDGLSQSLAIYQTLGSLKKIDLETTLAANSAILRRMGAIEYFCNTKNPGSWYAIMNGHYNKNPQLSQVLESMGNQMEITATLKDYINDILSIESPIKNPDLELKKSVWLKDEKAQMHSDTKQAMNDISLKGSFLWDTYSYGLDHLSIVAKAFSTDSSKGMFKAYLENSKIYFITCEMGDRTAFSYFTPSGILMSVIDKESSENYYLRDISNTENHWAQVANLGYQLIKNDKKIESQ